jgi:radical SAM-linked protein
VRYRLRFRKQDDLRWISHRDLVRVVERMVRRAGLALRMSAGFHPKPKLMFPSALAVGIAAQAEVLEFELAAPLEPSEIQRRLNAQAPPGLEVFGVETLAAGEPKAQIRRLTYEFPVPSARHAEVERAMAQLLASDSLLVEREGRAPAINLRPQLTALGWRGDAVEFQIAAGPATTLRPRDVLAALGALDLEQQGSVLTRSAVEIAA